MRPPLCNAIGGFACGFITVLVQTFGIIPCDNHNYYTIYLYLLKVIYINCKMNSFRIIASASFDKSVKLWEASTGKFITTLRGHVQAVYMVAWSADSRLLLSSSADSTLKGKSRARHFKLEFAHGNVTCYYVLFPFTNCI